MRGAIAILLFSLLGGCLHTSSGMRIINSEPPGATVIIEGFGECETPCSVKLDGYRSVLVAKAGYKPQKFGIVPKGPPVEVILELAAPTDDVDQETLPDL